MSAVPAERAAAAESSAEATDTSPASLGRAVRAERTRLGITLRQLASLSGLSASFISQLENDLVHPSIPTLDRIGRQLGTTAQALIALGDPAPTSVVRRGSPVHPTHAGVASSGRARALVRGDRALSALEVNGSPHEFADYFQHPGEEILYIVEGEIELDLDGELIQLAPGDAVTYDGLRPHRTRSTCDGQAYFRAGDMFRVGVQQDHPLL